MPNRIIREDILTSERVARLSWGAEVFYRRLMSKVDDFGRFDGRDAVLRTALFPIQIDKVSERDIGKWRLETVEAGLVTFYDVDGKDFVQIERFGEPRAKDSKYPPPPPPASTCAQTRADASGCEQTPTNAPYSYSSSYSESNPNPKEPPLPPSGESAVPKRKERSTFDPLGIAFPPEMQAEGFPEAWVRWVEYRRPAGLKPVSWQAQAKKFAEHGPIAAVIAIDQSITNGWTGVFPEKCAVGRQLGFRSSELTFQGLKDFVGDNPDEEI